MTPHQRLRGLEWAVGWRSSAVGLCLCQDAYDSEHLRRQFPEHYR